MSAKLHELVVGEHRALEELLEETGGEFTPEIEQLLTELDLKIEEKLERVGVYYKQQVADAETCKEMAAHFTARAKAFTTGAEGLKSYAERMMRLASVEKVKRPLATLAIQMNPPSVQGELDEEALRTLAQFEPAMVTHRPETWSLNKRAVLDAAKAGKEIPAGLSVEQSSSLRIR